MAWITQYPMYQPYMVRKYTKGENKPAEKQYETLAHAMLTLNDTVVGVERTELYVLVQARHWDDGK